jgi:hypothetical protein
MKTFFAASTVALFTAACATAMPEDGGANPTAPAPEAPGSCNAEAVRDLVGRPNSAELGVDAQRRSGARTVRVIRPGDAVTMDYRVDRLNIELDADGKVARFNCG